MGEPMSHIRVMDPNEGSDATYTLDDFRSWACEVFLEGYKRDVPFPSLEEAIEVVETNGCTVERLP